MTDVGGISVPLTLDKSGWSAGLKQARTEYDAFRSHISQTGGMAGAAGVGRVAPGVVGPTPGVRAPAGPPMATVGNVSPRFAVSAGSVRDMRIEINKQLRTFASQGEAINIPIKLGRVNYGQMRGEISAGIGEVPIRITLDPTSVSHIRGQIVGAIGTTGGGGRVAPGQTTLPTVRRRASGGPVYMQRGGPIRARSAHGYDLTAAELRPHVEAYRHISEMGVNRPLSAWGGNIWYPGRRRAILEQALASGHLTTGQGIGPMVRSARAAIAVPAIASPGTPDRSIAAWVREIMAVGQQHRGQNVDAKQLVIDIQRRTRLAPGRSYNDLTKAMQVVLGQRRWEDILGPSSPKVGPFARASMGNRRALVADSHHLMAGLFGDNASRVGKPTRAFPMGRPTRERAIMLAASEQVHGEYRDVWPTISQWQAGIWGEHFEAATGGGKRQPIENAYTNIIVPKGARHNIPSGWRSGTQGILTKMQRGGRAGRGFCSVCRSNVTDPLLHRSTAKHIANVRGKSRGTGRYLRERQPWMNAQRFPEGDEEGYEEKVTTYPGGKWHPGMWSGGRARAYAATIEQGGGTFDPQGQQPSSGYAVGLAEGTASQVAQEDRLGFIRGYRGISKAGSPYVGTWLHEGQINIDPSGVMSRKRDAMALARRNKQLAIFSIGKGEEISVPQRRARRQRLLRGGRVAPLPPGTSMPPEFGTAPLREGYVRAFHSTKETFDPATQTTVRTRKENLDRIRAEGLKLNKGIGETYGEPNAMWFSGDVGGYGDQSAKYAVEAHLPARWFDRSKKLRHDPYTVGGPNSNMAVEGNISRRRFASYSEPWMRHARYLNEEVGRVGGTAYPTPRTPGGVMRDIGPMVARWRRGTRGADEETLDTIKGYDQFVAEQWRKRKHRQGGGKAIRELLSRAGPGKEQLREIYGKRLTGMTGAFSAPYMGRAGLAIKTLGSTLSAEQRQAPIDLEKAMGRLPSALREPGMTKSFERHARDQHALSMGIMSEQYGGLQGRREPFQSPLMEPTASGMWRTIDPRELPHLDPGKISRNQRGGKTRVKGRVARDIVGGPINYWDDPGLRKADLYRPDVERKFRHNPWLPFMPYTRGARSTDDIEGGQGGVFRPRVASDEDLALARRLGEHFTYTNINRKRLMQRGGEVLKLSTVGKGGIARINSLKQLRHYIAENPGLFSRWTPNIKADMQPGATSATTLDRRLREIGISSHHAPMYEGMPHQKLVSSTYDAGPAYGDWRYREGRGRLGLPGYKRRRLWLMEGQPVGYGTDDEPLLDPTSIKPRAAVSRRALEEYYGERGGRFAAGGWLARMAGTPRGEGASLSLRVADPEGLHLRPAAALAKVGQMAELSGNPIRVTNETAGKTIGYPATGSVIGWTALLGAPRQGHKLNISVGGTETARVVDLLEKLIRFEGPQKTGQSYFDFHDSLGISSPLITRMRLGKMAAGGDAGEGMYIVNEIGREKFVPDHMSHMIPPDVFEQLPKRQEGGITEIEGHGPTLWQAPEDGWIIPARLANKVPGRHRGGPIGHRHPEVPGQESFDFPQTPVSMGRLGIPEPERETWGGIINRVRPPRAGPRETWSGAMGGQGNAARDFASGIGNAFRGAMSNAVQTVFGQRGGAPMGPARMGAPGMGANAPPPPTPPLFTFTNNPRLGPTGGGQTPNLVPAHLVEPVAAARGSMQSIRAQLRQDIRESRGFTPNRMASEGLSAEQLARQSAAETRGLTGRAAVGSFFGSILGGGRARKQAMQEGQQLMREAQALGPEGMPRGVSAVEAWGDVIGDLTSKVTSATREKEKLIAATDDETKGTEAYRTELGRLNKDIKSGENLIRQHTETQTEAAEKEHQANRKFAQASGGALRNIASLTVAGFAFSALQEGITTAFTLASSAAKPLIDQLGGFGSTATRITQGLAPVARQLGGNIPAVLGQAGGAAGIGGGGLDFLQQRLTGPITAKAGAQAQQEASDLFRAAMGANNAPTGLFGGFGGIGGGPLLGEFLGGGKGLTEILAGDIGAFRTQGQGKTGFGLIDMLGGPTAEEYGPGATPPQDPERMREGLRGLTTRVEDWNAAVARGTTAQGEHTSGLRLATREQLGLTEATDDAAQATMEKAGADAGDAANAAELAKQGVFLVDQNKRVIESGEAYQKFFEQGAKGTLIQSQEAYAAQQALGIEAGRQLSAAQREETVRQIPTELGLQLAAQPFMPARTGIRGTTPAQRAELAGVGREQRALTERGQAGLAAEAARIDVRAGPAQGARFRELTAEITDLGQEIANITAEVANKQAAVSFKNYAHNLFLINRGISDARGLAGQAGGSAFGQMQRQQFMLGRESQRLSLQSTRLGLEANALQLELAQRQINYQRAVAGFAAPGVTPEEIAANVEAAEIEAEFAQKQLDIGKQQQGIGVQQYGISGRQFGLELSLFMEAARRGVVDLEAQRELLVASRELEQLQIISQKKIATRTAVMGEKQAEAQALVLEGTQNHNASLQSAAGYVAMFGGTLANAITAINRAVKNLNTTAYKPVAPSPTGPTGASGLDMFVSGPTNFLAGEAGPEHVLVLRNPRAGSLPALGGGGDGGTVIIDVHDNTLATKEDEQKIMNLIVAAVEKAQARKLTLIGGRAT